MPRIRQAAAARPKILRLRHEEDRAPADRGKVQAKAGSKQGGTEALDSEYELWQTENQYSADEDTLLAKKMENAAAEIANQTDRVAIAQAKYDEMLKRWGADKTETKEAYASLLSEKDQPCEIAGRPVHRPV